MSTFSLTLSERHRCVIAACSGSLDLAAVVAERDRLSAAAASGPCLFVLDLGGVTFLDSTALGLFVVLHRRLAQHGGALVLANVDRRVGRPIALMQLDSVIFVHWAEESRLSWTGDPALVVLAHTLGIDERVLTSAGPIAS